MTSKKLLSRVAVRASIEVEIEGKIITRLVEATYENKALFKKRNRKDKFWIDQAVREHSRKKNWSPDQIVECNGKVDRSYD